MICRSRILAFIPASSAISKALKSTREDIPNVTFASSAFLIFPKEPGAGIFWYRSTFSELLQIFVYIFD